jgi:hypothetical protein
MYTVVSFFAFLQAKTKPHDGPATCIVSDLGAVANTNNVKTRSLFEKLKKFQF